MPYLQSVEATAPDREKRPSKLEEERLDESSSEQFEGEVTVASRIVDYLSSGLYSSPAACLKELINNSYDADATQVRVGVKPDADRIVIYDDGIGFNRSEFERHFERVSESHKRDCSEKTERGRPKIGKIGIGFVAANEVCERMEIISTKEGSHDKMRVVLDFKLMRKSKERRREDEKGEGFAKADYKGEVRTSDAGEHYTRLILHEVRGHARQLFAGAHEGVSAGENRSLYGLNPESICQALKRKGLKTWDDFDAYTKTRLGVALNVPVPYHKGWLPERLKEENSQGFEQELEKLEFEVVYDGSPLRKPLVFDPESGSSNRAFVSSFEYSGEAVSAQGYFYVQHGTIRPKELQGLLVRIRRAAIGGYDSSFLGFPSSQYSLIQRWVSAEVWADDRLEDAMNINRSEYQVTHPAYQELQKAIHEHLAKVLSRAQKEIYSAGSDQRKKKRASEAARDIGKTVENVIKPSSPKVAQEVTRKWEDAKRSKKSRKMLLKKYSVAQLYESVIETAREVLPPELMGRFVQRLTEKLLDEE
jgi:hypothetical protein